MRGKPLIGALLLFLAGAAARGDVVSAPEASPAKPPSADYQHTSLQGRLGKFELRGDKGTADYYYNGVRRQDGLVFVRQAELTGDADPRIGKQLGGKVPGFVYQVSNKGTRERIWFFFADKPIDQDGPKYVMYLSFSPPDRNGKQVWTRILTRGTTRKVVAPKGQDD